MKEQTKNEVIMFKKQSLQVPLLATSTAALSADLYIINGGSDEEL